MASRDADDTRRRILSAARAEFSRWGVAGARVDRVAREARCSKERVYAYYGDKAALFTRVLNDAFDELAETMAGDAESLEAFALAIFDHLAMRPENQRLLEWARVEDHHDWAASETAMIRVRDAADARLEGLLRDRDVPKGWQPEHVFTLVMGLALAWTNTPRSALTRETAAVDELAIRRTILRQSISRLLPAV